MSFFARGIKNSSYLFASRVLLIILGLATSVLVTRGLSLREYGSIATVISYVSVFTYFSFNGISSYVSREGMKNVSLLANFIEETSGIKFLFALMAQILCISFLVVVPYAQHIKILILFFSSYILIHSFLSHWIIVFNVHEKFHYRAFLNIFPNLFYLITAIIIIQNNYSDKVILLLAMNLVSIFFTLLLCYIFSQRVDPFKISIFKFNFDKDIIIGGTYFFLITLGGLLFAKIDVFMVTLLGSEEQVAIYNISNKIVRQGAELRTAIYAGFFPVLVKEINKGSIEIKKLYKITFSLFIIVLLGAIFMNLFSVDIFTLLYGNKYALSGQLFGLLCFFLAIDFSIQPYVILLLAIGHEKMIAIFFSILAITNMVANIIFFKYWALWGIVYSTLLTYSLFFILIISFSLTILNKQKDAIN